MSKKDMHKLLVSDIIELSDGEYLLDLESKKLGVIIDGKVTIYLINQKISKLNITLKDQSILNIYIYNTNKEDDLVVDIKQFNDSKIFYNAAFINKTNSYLEINNVILGNNNESNINIRNISENNLSKIIVNMEITKGTFDNIALEDLKGINNGGFVHIEPNIVCLSNEVVANHLTTIGGINQDYLNYLMSKGIKENIAKNILLDSFIISNMDEYIKGRLGGE